MDPGKCLDKIIDALVNMKVCTDIEYLRRLQPLQLPTELSDHDRMLVEMDAQRLNHLKSQLRDDITKYRAMKETLTEGGLPWTPEPEPSPRFSRIDGANRLSGSTISDVLEVGGRDILGQSNRMPPRTRGRRGTGAFRIVFSDYLIDEDRLDERLADMFGRDIKRTSWTWSQGNYIIINAPVPELTPDQLQRLRL